eukprot:TRINITY_DN4882_c0_g1_i2.p1 TRINITY_DN4882_c0_g1~~TRINITY_DN4882_c0_g1_i2.p1  ORF type:complete len:121 (-),score=0.33 TRINITY_DN4882_c0_g1_i2:31-393(-)
MQNAAIVRNKLKIRATIANAIATLRVQKEFGSFSNYLWAFMPDNRPILNNFNAMSDLPSKTDLSTKISKDLKKRGFRFVGPTTIYAFMQACGMVNDHTTDCFLYHGASKTDGSKRSRTKE